MDETSATPGGRKTDTKLCLKKKKIRAEHWQLQDHFIIIYLQKYCNSFMKKSNIFLTWVSMKVYLTSCCRAVPSHQEIYSIQTN